MKNVIIKRTLYIHIYNNISIVESVIFPVVMYGCENWTIKKAEWWRVDALALWCCRILESPLGCKEVRPVNLKGNHPWIFIESTGWPWSSNTLATWCEELTHVKRPWCWERLKAGGEWHNRGWDGWMASLTQWTGVWVGSGNWWWTGKPGMLQSVGLQRVEHDWVTELNCIKPLWQRLKEEIWVTLYLLYIWAN